MLVELHRELFGELPEPARELPEDIYELRNAIAFQGFVQIAHQKGIAGFVPGPPLEFERFHALDCQLGGMGMVIEAYDPKLERKVAIKLWILPDSALDDAALDEAKILARLTHPNVVQIHEVGDWNGRIYFVMEWVEGRDGYRWMLEPRSWREIRDVYVEAGEGLAAAHDAGIQHRDFKPSNMLIGDDGRVRVADFGVADSLLSHDDDDEDEDEDDDDGEEPSKVAGTPAYIAPERLRGGRGDGRSDQFSFCVALWEALHGVRPFAGKTRKTVLSSIEAGELRTGPLAEDVPGWLRRAVRKGLAEDPKLRYADMRALIEALLDEPREDRSGMGDEARTDTARPPQARPRWGFAGGLAVGLALALVVLLVQRPDSPRPAEDVPDPSVDPLPEREVSRALASPCALPYPADAGVELDPVVEQVCRLIRDDHYEAADMLWEREYAARKQDQVKDATLGENVLIVARTFVHQAEQLTLSAPARARAAAQSAVLWANRAATELGQEDLGVRDITRRANRFNHSKHSTVPSSLSTPHIQAR